MIRPILNSCLVLGLLGHRLTAIIGDSRVVRVAYFVGARWARRNIVPGYFFFKTFFKYFPVCEAGFAAICSGVPRATICPPPFPPSGPISIT